MGQTSDRAIVLRLSDYSETSQIVTLLTAEGGLVRLIAKGARRATRSRASVGLDLLELGEVAFTLPRGDAQLGLLTEWVQRDAFLGLRRDMSCLTAGLYAAEAAAALTHEHDPHPRLFDALLRMLGSLAEDADAPPAAAGQTDAEARAAAARLRAAGLLVRFQMELLREAGYEPVLDRCAGCGKVRPARSSAVFNSSAGGLLCRSCAPRHAERLPLSSGMLDRGPESDPSAWFALLDHHIGQVVGRALGSGAWLRARMKPTQSE